MDSIGSGEILVIAVVALLALDPRTAGRWWGKMRKVRGRIAELRADLEHGMREPLEEAPLREPPVVRLRRWARERVESLGQTEIDSAGGRLVARLRGWDLYRDATDVAVYWPLKGEPPLEPVLRAVLEDGKRLWVPWLGDATGAMDMAPVANLESDLVAGRWGTREPRPGLRGAEMPQGALVLVPGAVFDLHGSRIGKGGGYYDRWLARRPDVVATGCGWDVQVHPGRLPVEPHDVPMAHLLTELRLKSFRS